MIDTEKRVRIAVLIIHEITQSPSIENIRTLMRVCFGIRCTTHEVYLVCVALEEVGALTKHIVLHRTYTITPVGKKMVLEAKRRARLARRDIADCMGCGNPLWNDVPQPA